MPAKELTFGDTELLITTGQIHGLLRNQMAYVLATALWETAHTMKPVRETLASSTDQAISILERAWGAGKLPWVKTPYWRRDSKGRSWLGRGYVQLTWFDNYKKAEEILGIDLTTNPERALDPRIAAEILVKGMKDGWFTGKKLSDYITLQKSDFYNARRIVNGLDRASEIQALAREYDRLLLQNGYGVEETPVETDWEEAAISLLEGIRDLINEFLEKEQKR